MKICKDFDSDCEDIKNKVRCYKLAPEEGYCPFLISIDVELLEDDLFEI